MDTSTMFKLSYGLYVLSVSSGDKDNACIINTCAQVTDIPLVISITVNKTNYTTELIAKSGKFCVSILDESADFELFKRFGFSSGRDKDKFAGIATARSDNGLLYLTNSCNGYIEAQVINQVDLGTHYVFFATVIGVEKLNANNSLTYDYYSKHIKPRPKPKADGAKYVCSVCNYVFEGDVIPDDFICPICKHGKDVFNKI